jgi:hypothetical protein
MCVSVFFAFLTERFCNVSINNWFYYCQTLEGIVFLWNRFSGLIGIEEDYRKQSKNEELTKPCLCFTSSCEIWDHKIIKQAQFSRIFYEFKQFILQSITFTLPPESGPKSAGFIILILFKFTKIMENLFFFKFCLEFVY